MTQTAAPATSGLQGRHIVLALSGGIACYKAADLARQLIKAGATVQVVMTEAATQFITPLTLQALTGRPVFTSAWDSRAPANMAHIDLSREADALLIAPATADVIARLAQGRADDLLSLLAVARPRERCALWVAPAMNREMWSHPATQRNVAQIQADGAVVLGPDHGEQACGEVGEGRMLEPEVLVELVDGLFQPRSLAGRRVLITAGPTFEPIDPVRGITNRSSGKMGFALARACREAGAQVTLVAGPVSLPTPWGVNRIDVQSALDMHQAVMARMSSQDLFIATAAVADWRPAQVRDQKIKKDGTQQVPALDMVENPDILATVAALPLGQRPFCVGFAAESHHVEEHAAAKRRRKNIPLIVANDGPATFGQDNNALTLIDDLGTTPLPRADKLSLARQLVLEIARRLSAGAVSETSP